MQFWSFQVETEKSDKFVSMVYEKAFDKCVILPQLIQEWLIEEEVIRVHY